VAFADDIASRFVGFSFGVNAGAAWGHSSYATNPNCVPTAQNGVFCIVPPDPSAVNGPAVAASGTGTLSPRGAIGGAQAGYNWRSGAIVYGGEIDFAALNLRQTATATGLFPSHFLATQYTLTDRIKVDWLATLRGRLGVAVAPQLLLYATGGAALAQVELSSAYADNAIGFGFPGGTGFASTSKIKPGWTLGGGAQWALERNWSVKAEYLYTNFGSVTVAVPLTNTPSFNQVIYVSSDLDVHVARIGLDYRL
jgi:outer membrane immunogenic protein